MAVPWKPAALLLVSAVVCLHAYQAIRIEVSEEGEKDRCNLEAPSFEKCRDFVGWGAVSSEDEVRYYYDSKEGRCDRYASRYCPDRPDAFTSNIECSRACLGRGVCRYRLPVVMCLMMSETGWYYDPTRKQCATFEYAACPGILNNFASEEECSSFCHGVSGEFVDPE
ncbi:PREDICTED: kunitz-type serine protease inhibitor bitisilin-3-like [Priapulus caudatus]|uniref:Kunitz-type serine protease inhibitor bitisilin-3-like n=1 Tax=Priapulus caudatus TaxID=37621 RepID=A0ABM1E0Q9_PRICU|nr:PREDICTED: kunitz-type serine protease inhibitor bitisilin-3-like [Priapulus caudatus]